MTPLIIYPHYWGIKTERGSDKNGPLLTLYFKKERRETIRYWSR